MDYDIGNAKFIWSAQERAPIGQTGLNDPKLNPDPKLLYLWDCLKQTGTPEPRPKAIVPRAHIRFFAHGLSLAFGGGDLKKVTDALQLGFLARTGMTPQQIRAKLDQDFKFSNVNVPYDKLIDPFKAKETRRLYAQVEYIRWLGLDRPSQAMEMNLPYVSLDIPISVRFLAQTVCVCERGDLLKRYLARDESVVRLPLSDGAKTMLKQHEKELCERLRKGNFQELLGEELPPLGSGKDAPGDEGF